MTPLGASFECYLELPVMPLEKRERKKYNIVLDVIVNKPLKDVLKAGCKWLSCGDHGYTAVR